MRRRLFKSALNNVTYVLGQPYSLIAFLKLPRDKQQQLFDQVR